jgi:hypothetical protein
MFCLSRLYFTLKIEIWLLYIFIQYSVIRPLKDLLSFFGRALTVINFSATLHVTS